ncbi:MAG: hypothetical protein BWX87_02374 [Bacteroidetes bacterium ADurb.Bin123]|mgnify:CR=1 FL=1|jgi:hypothetical protein|nr:MAG: hypothetical protein BWX87_02374 [Bacteroidetes bacterium ADurb.Bin123]
MKKPYSQSLTSEKRKEPNIILPLLPNCESLDLQDWHEEFNTF